MDAFALRSFEKNVAEDASVHAIQKEMIESARRKEKVEGVDLGLISIPQEGKHLEGIDDREFPVELSKCVFQLLGIS